LFYLGAATKKRQRACVFAKEDERQNNKIENS